MSKSGSSNDAQQGLREMSGQGVTPGDSVIGSQSIGEALQAAQGQGISASDPTVAADGGFDPMQGTRTGVSAAHQLGETPGSLNTPAHGSTTPSQSGPASVASGHPGEAASVEAQGTMQQVGGMAKEAVHGVGGLLQKAGESVQRMTGSSQERK